MTRRRKSKPEVKPKLEPSPPPARPPRALATDRTDQTTSAINRAVITLNGALNIAAASLRRRIDGRFDKLERLLAAASRPPP